MPLAENSIETLGTDSDFLPSNHLSLLNLQILLMYFIQPLRPT